MSHIISLIPCFTLSRYFVDCIFCCERCGGRVRGRPRLGWMDGVKVALGNRGMTVEAARKTGKRGEPWYICN